MQNPRVWAEIDLDRIAANLGTVRRHVGPEVEIMAVVKADAYGHGAVEIARAVLCAGASRLGVGDSGEALELRSAGITAPILVLGGICDSEIEYVVEHHIGICAHSERKIKEIERAAAAQRVVHPVTILVDTGMGRLGVRPQTALKFAGRIARSTSLSLEGVATHFATANRLSKGPREGSDVDFFYEQLDRFIWVVTSLRRSGISVPLYHTASSAALFASRSTHYSCVRPGIALYGLDPGNFRDLGVSVSPAMTLRTQIVFLKDVGLNTPISYEGTFRTYRPTKIATLPLGYSDGYPVSLSNRAEVLVRGRRAPVIGRVTMDYMMIDVGHIPDVNVGDEVTLIGRDGKNFVSAEHIAELAGSIPYEITTRLGRRVKRFYEGGAGGLRKTA
ncbi:MAG: alanine racemase [Planctomycetota bacterium]|jgi:alanine racemase